VLIQKVELRLPKNTIIQISKFDGGVILVTHDARLIQAINSTLWVVNVELDGAGNPVNEWATIKKHERGFVGYKNDVLEELEMRQERIDGRN
jgi:ATPase subunit of ABC transporter with duplicated ATPase domains